MPLTVTIKGCASIFPPPLLTTAALVLADVFGLVRVAGADSQTFNFTGAVQTFTTS
jgi:hypothetical protein